VAGDRLRPARAGGRGLLLAVALVGALGPLGPLAGRARAQDGDFDSVGRLDDARRQATPMSVGDHSFEPSIVYRLLGVVTPHVFGALSGGYTDNLLLQDRNGSDPLVRALYGRAEGGVRLDAELGQHRAELEYRAAGNAYVDAGSNNTVEQLVRARLDLLWNDASAHGDASYTRAAYAQSIQLRGIVRLDVYTASAYFDAHWAKLGGRAGLAGRRDDYRERELRALDDHALLPYVQLYYRVSPKLRALVEYDLEHESFDHRPDLDGYDDHQLRGGLDGELTPKLSASLKVGVAFLRARGATSGRRAYTGFSAALSLRWDVRPDTQLGAAYARRLEPSVSSTYLISDDGELSLTQRLADGKVKARGALGYTHSHVGPGEAIDRVRARASVSWNIRQWLSITAAYEFVHVDSTVPKDDYDVHTVTVSIGVGL
jgi:hypothetical protein